MYSLLSRPKEDGYAADSFGAFLVETLRKNMMDVKMHAIKKCIF